MENENNISLDEAEKEAIVRKEQKQAFDTNRAKKNVIVSILFKVLLLAASLVARRFLINYAGNEANGLNSLYTSIIGFLGIAELGIGTAIVYCMYEPIANNDLTKVRQLYTLFKRIYLVIGIIVLTLGLIISIFLPGLSKGYEDYQTLYISYYISLAAVVITYFYSAKMSLINAYKNNYVSTLITSIGLLVQYALQILVVVLTKNFIWYCVCKIGASLIQLIIFSLVNRYKDITSKNEKIEDELKNEVVKNVKAMFLHKIGDVIFGTVDSIVISTIIGVVVLGYYSNYQTILLSMNEVLKLFIIPLTTIIGHMGVIATNKEKKDYFKFFYSINFILVIVFYLGYFSVCSDLVTLLFGEGLELDTNIIIVMTITYYIQFMRQSASVFKDSFGLFYKDRYIAIIAAIVNAGLSIGLAFAFGIYGVLIATIVVDILMYHIVEPLVLFKYGFEDKPFKYYILNYSLIAFFIGEVFLFNTIHLSFDSVFVHLLVSGSLSIAFNIIPVGIVVLVNPKIKKKIGRILHRS